MANSPKTRKSLFYNCFHELYGGFYILHPSEYVAPNGTFDITWGVGELGIRATREASVWSYPFIIDSQFKLDSMKLTLTLTAYGVYKDPLYKSIVILSNQQHYYEFNLPPFISLKLTLLNETQFSITDSTVKPIFIYSKA
jgi:hypothetical protein